VGLNKEQALSRLESLFWLLFWTENVTVATTLHNDQDVRICATEGNDYGVIGATFDGVRFQHLDQYRIDSGFYNLTIPADNIFKEKPGMYRAFTNGFFVFLQPLHPGTHDLHLTVSVTNPIKPTYNYAADWTYHLIVKP
jgi:hypothetical protein